MGFNLHRCLYYCLPFCFRGWLWWFRVLVFCSFLVVFFSFVGLWNVCGGGGGGGLSCKSVSCVLYYRELECMRECSMAWRRNEKMRW
jgi:hypothetical protein